MIKDDDDDDDDDHGENASKETSDNFQGEV